MAVHHMGGGGEGGGDGGGGEGGGEGGGGLGGGDGGGGDGGGDGDEMICWPQMTKPLRVTEPSVYHVIVAPCAIATFAGPDVPRYRVVLGGNCT